MTTQLWRPGQARHANVQARHANFCRCNEYTSIHVWSQPWQGVNTRNTLLFTTAQSLLKKTLSLQQTLGADMPRWRCAWASLVHNDLATSTNTYIRNILVAGNTWITTTKHNYCTWFIQSQYVKIAGKSSKKNMTRQFCSISSQHTHRGLIYFERYCVRERGLLTLWIDIALGGLHSSSCLNRSHVLWPVWCPVWHLWLSFSKYHAR